jgi:hypothetical protein
MGHPAAPLLRRATYADLAAVLAHQVAEIIRGTLRVMPRPAPTIHRDGARVRVPPFEGVELSALWAG